jgi:hypothetical protein
VPSYNVSILSCHLWCLALGYAEAFWHCLCLAAEQHLTKQQQELTEGPAGPCSGADTAAAAAAAAAAEWLSTSAILESSVHKELRTVQRNPEMHLAAQHVCNRQEQPVCAGGLVTNCV